jgi:threonine aldolase
VEVEGRGLGSSSHFSILIYLYPRRKRNVKAALSKAAAHVYGHENQAMELLSQVSGLDAGRGLKAVWL